MYHQVLDLNYHLEYSVVLIKEQFELLMINNKNEIIWFLLVTTIYILNRNDINNTQFTYLI